MEDYGSLGLFVDSVGIQHGGECSQSGPEGPHNCSGHGSTIRLVNPTNVVEKQIKLHPSKYVGD